MLGLGKETLLEIYREAQKNVPLLKYGWVFIGAIAILGLVAFLRVGSFKDVSLATLVILSIALLAYVLSWAIKRVEGDWIIKFALYVLVYAIVGSIVAILISFPLHLFGAKEFPIYENFVKFEPSPDTTISTDNGDDLDIPMDKGGPDDPLDLN